MTPERVRQILEAVAAGRLTTEAAERELAWLPFEPLRDACVDHHRALRQDLPEVIFGEGKTADQVRAIAHRLADRGHTVLATRLRPDALAALQRDFPSAEVAERARAVWIPGSESSAVPVRGPVLVVAAGTSDLPVAEEAILTARAFGNPVQQLVDVGVAGLHRLLAHRQAVGWGAGAGVGAGPGGARPSLGARVGRGPAIRGPPGGGYGAAFGGLAALLGMLNSCAAGLLVVNIDSGFGAAVAATRINRRAGGNG